MCRPIYAVLNALAKIVRLQRTTSQSLNVESENDERQTLTMLIDFTHNRRISYFC